MSFLARFLPPPKFLDMPTVAIDVSDRSLKYVELVMTRRGLRLGRFGEKSLDPGIIEAGEIKKPDELSSFLAALFKPLGVRFVIASLPEERAYVATLKLPNIDDSRSLRSAIEAELPEHVPLPEAETVFDYEIIPVSDIVSPDAITDDAPPHLDVAVYAFPRPIAETYAVALEGAGLLPLALEMETHALTRALLPQGGADAPVMLVDFGKTRVTFVIAVGNLVRFASTASVAGESLERALAKTLGISIAQAEGVKKEKGLIRNRENEAVFNALLPVVSAVTDEIERHILFWNTHAEHVHQSPPSISKIILCGGDSNLVGFREYVAQKIRIPVERGNIWTNVASFDEYIPEISRPESLGFGAAVGLALRAHL